MIGFLIKMIGVIIIISAYSSSGGDSEATIEMNGEDSRATVSRPSFP